MYYFGIDFGTTNTSVYLHQTVSDTDHTVVASRGFGDPSSKERIPFSSYLALSPDGTKSQFGAAVKKNREELQQQGYTVWHSFKNLLDQNDSFLIAGHKYNGISIVAGFLKFVKQCVDRECSEIAADLKLSQAVFSIPVGFSPEARKNLRSAAERAGIHVKQLITESTAAYFSVFSQMQMYSNVLVIDWGGGTLDLSVLSLHESRIDEKAVQGIRIGGDDIDELVARRIYSKMKQETVPFEKAVNKDRLLHRAEQIKCFFSDDESDVDIPVAGSAPISFTYREFCDIVRPIVQDNVLRAMDTVLHQAGLEPAGIDAVVIAGGSSRIREFAGAVEQIFGLDKLHYDETNYQWMVADGAALFHAAGGELRLTDDICILLSDQSVYPLLRQDTDRVGGERRTLTVSQTDDAEEAHFIFTDRMQKTVYGEISVMSKGFLDEEMNLTAGIDTDQIARIRIRNASISSSYEEKLELNKLRFYYDLSIVAAARRE